jgi:site-specific DNA-cytosine methylase
MYTLDGTSEHAVAITEGAHGVTTTDVVSSLAGEGGKPGQGYGAVMVPGEVEVGVFPDPRRHDATHRGTRELRDKPSLNTNNNDLLLAPPLRTNERNNSNPTTDALSKVYTPMGVRKLTPLECERLQGFDDGWTCLCDAQGVTASCTCPDSPRYRALGNAIAVPVMRWIAERIMLVERSES